MEARKYIDCREQTSSYGCTLKISGKEEEVIKAAIDHAIATHGAEDSLELVDHIRRSLKAETPEKETRPKPDFIIQT